MKYFLCGQTGNRNRGCEAIVRSTVKLLGVRNGDIFLATYNPLQDDAMARELGITMIPYAKYPTAIHRYLCAAIRKVFKFSLCGYNRIEKPLFDRLSNDSVCLNIGGDTYCYGRPMTSLALCKFTKKKRIKNILWCCSVEKENVKGEILKNLKTYDYIFAREQITYDALISLGMNSKKVIKVCDPAFFLDKKVVALPKNFLPQNTVGINVSELVIGEENPSVYKNVINLIKYIIAKTDMSVCLIPHVYSVKDNTNDYPILKRIYDEIGSERLSIIDKEYDCEELKYIISQCRFFVGARTHSTIAAYSSEIPTLVLGYSVKSKGIANDLFGTYKDYVLPYNELNRENELTEKFELLVAREQEIKQIYKELLPQYKRTLTDAIDTYIAEKNSQKPFEICDLFQCTGCGACAAACPKECINMIENYEGFLCPDIDFEACINCGLCKKICPVANKPCDDKKTPKSMAMVNCNDSIRQNSSSGGIFTLLAEQIISEGGVVFGAAFDEHFNLVHKKCETLEELEALRGSKYLQSRIGDTYKEAKAELQRGRAVLFTGTPCQIGGLYAYLDKDYDNLYTQDLICHGVPSPKAWGKYVCFRERCADSSIKKVLFRNKKYGWKRYSVCLDFSNNTQYAQLSSKDLYMRSFLANMCLRNSCSECSFKQIHRISDITLADFWGIEKIMPEINDDKGTSLVLIHSKKGEELIKNISDSTKAYEVDFNEAKGGNASLFRSSKSSKFRDAFLRDIDKMPFDRAVNRYLGNKLFSKIRRIISKFF